jgi:hypothetical protein
VWPFAGNALNVDNLKSSSALCGGWNEPSVLTAQSLGLTAPSMAQVGTSVGLKVTPEDVRPCPMPAPSVSRNFGRQKEENK